MLIVTVWVVTFLILLFWALIQKNKLHEINRYVEAAQTQNKIIKDKIQTLSRTLANSAVDSDKVASHSAYPSIHLTKYLNQIAKNYVQGTTIDYIHIQEGQKILIEGKALHPSLVTKIVDKWTPFEDRPFKIKIKSINPQTKHVAFSIEAE